MVEGIGGQSFQIRPPQELPDLGGSAASRAAGSAGAAGSIGSGAFPGSSDGQVESFGDTLKHFLGEVNDMQFRSDGFMQAFIRGEVTDLHQVILAQQEAGLAVRLVGEMRDRLLQAYQEVMRMSM